MLLEGVDETELVTAGIVHDVMAGIEGRRMSTRILKSMQEARLCEFQVKWF